MRTPITIILLCISISLAGNTYYVATDGKDTNPGTIAQPWGTWQKAFATANAGDTVYFRGGTWYPKTAWAGGNNVCHIKPASYKGHDGTETNPIVFMAYPGETPILDGSLFVTTGHFSTAILLERVEWVNFKGLTIRNFFQRGTSEDYGDTISVVGINAYECSNLTFDNITIHTMGGRAYYYDSQSYYAQYRPDTTRWINCDVYNIIDTLNIDNPPAPGNMGDAWKAITYTGGYLYWSGCRAWNISDDGIDLSIKGSGIAFIDGNWIFDIGKLEKGNGNGIKIGTDSGDTLAVHGIIKNNLIAWCTNLYNNSAAGIEEIDYDQYEGPPYYGSPRTNSRIYNNTLYQNDIGAMAGLNSHHPYRNTVYRNNIAYDSRFVNNGVVVNVSIPWYPYPESHNTWDFYDPRPGSMPPWFVETDTVKVTDGDFISLDSTGISSPRKADGSLPDIDFLKLAPTSDLIDAGTQIPVSDNVRISLPYYGTAPDIGYSEYKSGTYTPATPIYLSSVIENANPASLEITYNLTLANVIPAASAFSVTVNSIARTVSSVAISGTKVLLTLSSPVAYGNIVTVSYTKPATNPLQTSSGGLAASITAQSVINNCSISANIPPTVSISSPHKSTSFIAPATIIIDVFASDSDGTIRLVEFFNGSNKLGEIVTPPYSFTWKDVSQGTFYITAVATDNMNAKTTSDVVSIIVQKSATTINQAPTVTIIAPNKDKKNKKHDDIVIKVEATDPDGAIAKVELKDGSVTLVEMTTAPYEYILEDVDTGTYLITAIATDNVGATSTSSVLELKVEDIYNSNSELINLYPNPNDGHFVIDLLFTLPNENSKIFIVDSAGKIVYDEFLTEEDSLDFNLPYLASGTYTLVISSGNMILATKRLIKM